MRSAKRRKPKETMPIDAIKIGVRHRKDLGDISSLAESIDEVGLLHPSCGEPERKTHRWRATIRSLSVGLAGAKYPFALSIFARS